MEINQGNQNSGENEVIVHAPAGSVRGRRVSTKYGPEFVAFYAIPYAKPPVGRLRFMPPVAAEPWNGILDARTNHISESLLTRDIKYYWGCENCLYLSIRTKTVTPEKKLPVMVWIGGIGFSLDVTPDLCSGFLTDEDVLVVQVSYRIGVFGFLSLNDQSAAGNCGLKDFAMAIKWIKNNIDAFGGDSENVTLFGSGSGGSMVHYTLFTPLAKGMFHKAIIQSGTALHGWAITKNPTIATMKLARHLGIANDDPIEVVEILRSVPEHVILQASIDMVKARARRDGFPMYSLFRPCIESEFEGQLAFITTNPYTAMRKGRFNKVPVIIGCNKMEGHSFKGHLNEEESYQLYNKNLTSLIPSELCIKHEEAHTNKTIGQKLLQFYISDDSVSEDNVEHYFEFLSDYHIIYYINKCVKLYCQYGKERPVYYYVLDHKGNWGFCHEYKQFDIPAHASEMPYLFQIKHDKPYGSRESQRTRKKMVKLWTNFAKFGNPTPTDDDSLLQLTWKPVTHPDQLTFCNIGSDLTLGQNPFYDRMSFWDNLLDEVAYMRLCDYLKD